jgi:lipoyl(octanoyl) transferase
MNFFVLNSGKCDPAFNMALDEALLQAMPRLQTAVLRLYGWTEPASSFGYFQRYADVERATQLRPLIRRPTGGGIVPHDKDWTYSLAFPPEHDWHSLKAEESYRRVHEWLKSAFAKLQIETKLAPGGKTLHPIVYCSRRKEVPFQSGRSQSLLTPAAVSQCFVGHVKFDLLWRGRKIAGAAQRRNKLGLLIQGSIQPPPLSLRRGQWEDAMRETASVGFGASWQELKMDSVLADRTEQLARMKYSQAAYNQKR